MQPVIVAEIHVKRCIDVDGFCLFGQIVDGDLPTNMESIPLAAALHAYGRGEPFLPGYLLLPSRSLDILAESVAIDGVILPTPPRPQKKNLWVTEWRYAYQAITASNYEVCLHVDYRRIARRLLRRTATYLQGK